MFVGTSQNRIDDKNRLRMPIRYKAELGSTYFLAPGDKRCIYVFPSEKYANISQNLDKINFSDLPNKDFERFFFGNVAEIEEDKQNRFMIPQNLKSYAKIDKDVVIIGVNSRIEIWAKESWDKMQGSGDFDSLFEGLAKYGV